MVPWSIANKLMYNFWAFYRVEDLIKVIKEIFIIKCIGKCSGEWVKMLCSYVLHCKACLKTKFKCIFVTMHSLVISPFSRDFIKTKIDCIKYQQCFSLLTCIHTAPGF